VVVVVLVTGSEIAWMVGVSTGRNDLKNVASKKIKEATKAGNAYSMGTFSTASESNNDGILSSSTGRDCG
jgi:hypothetical protein